MTQKVLLIISSFFLIFVLLGCQTKNKIPNQPLVINQTTSAEFIKKYMACENDSDCWQVTDPNDFCCGRSYAINKEGFKEYYKIFAKEFKKKDEKCQKEYEKGLSCSLQLFEPVCIDKVCKLKDKMQGDKIIDNKFAR